MLPAWPPRPQLTDPSPPAVTRTRVRDRAASPSPLDQIPAWRDLVPVMDPALDDAAARPGSRRCSAA